MTMKSQLRTKKSDQNANSTLVKHYLAPQKSLMHLQSSIEKFAVLFRTCSVGKQIEYVALCFIYSFF